jgi:hypothetical protein
MFLYLDLQIIVNSLSIICESLTVTSENMILMMFHCNPTSELLP